MKPNKSEFFPVILAGGRGTRFWPLSRMKKAKQLLALDGKHTMMQQTVARLLPLAKADRFLVITNSHLQKEILRQVPRLDRKKVLAEPAARNTAPAIGLAAFILERTHPQAVIGMFPSDHVIGEGEKYRETLRQAIAIAQAGENIVVLGITPNRPETGYGYIEVEPKSGSADAETSNRFEVRRFTEKPDAERAAEFVSAGNYFWNSGMFVWSAKTLANALREHLPNTAAILEKIAATFGTKKFDATFARLYPKCENISIDYAVLEPRSAKGIGKSNLYCLPANFGWNDLGSWTALHEHHTTKKKAENDNVITSDSTFALNAHGNYIHAPGKFVAAVGIRDIVVVDSGDALLITTRAHAQDVGKIVKYLDEKRRHKLV